MKQSLFSEVCVEASLYICGACLYFRVLLSYCLITLETRATKGFVIRHVIRQKWLCLITP